MAKGFCVCHRTTADPQYLPAPGAAWHYLCDKPVLPVTPAWAERAEAAGATPSPEDWCASIEPEPEPASGRDIVRRGWAYDEEPDDGEAQRIAEVFEDARAEMDRELPWLGDMDRRADDDVEFCVEGED